MGGLAEGLATDPGWRDLALIDREDPPLVFAMVEHRAWVKALKSQLNGRSLPRPELVETACHFGHG